MARLYLGNADPRNPLASPVYADRWGVPPVLIHVGDAEVLLDDTLRCAEGSDGVEVHVWDGMLHLFPPVPAFSMLPMQPSTVSESSSRHT
jgi:acetyl esterase/lipase